MPKHKHQATADISSEQILLTPEHDGISGVPAISHSFYHTNWQALPEHVHDTIELCFCSRGSLVFECEGRTHTLLPNNVFLTQPGDRHHLITNHKGMRMYWLFFRYPRKDAAALGLSAAETAELVRRLRTIRPHVFAVHPAMRELFRDIFRTYELQARGPYRTLQLKTLILRILLTIISSSENKPTVKALATISRLAEGLRKNPDRRISIAELARRARLSESHFSALFRQVVGQPPYAYLADCRLQAVKERLRTSSDPIHDIAKSLGYASSQHLAAQFRKTYGITPGEWRRQVSRIVE